MSTLYEEKRQLVEKVESQQRDLQRLGRALARIEMIAFDTVETRSSWKKVKAIRDSFPK